MDIMGGGGGRGEGGRAHKDSDAMFLSKCAKLGLPKHTAPNHIYIYVCIYALYICIYVPTSTYIYLYLYICIFMDTEKVNATNSAAKLVPESSSRIQSRGKGRYPNQ